MPYANHEPEFIGSEVRACSIQLRRDEPSSVSTALLCRHGPVQSSGNDEAGLVL